MHPSFTSWNMKGNRHDKEIRRDDIFTGDNNKYRGIARHNQS